MSDDRALALKHARAKRYRENNKEKIRAQQKAWNVANVEWRRSYNKKYHAAHKDKATERNRQPRAACVRLLANARRRCIDREIEIDISFLEALVYDKPLQCECCGKALNYKGGKGRSGTSSHDSPSVDRIDVRYGYVRGNVGIICLRCNVLKRDASISDLEKLLSYMKRPK